MPRWQRLTPFITSEYERDSRPCRRTVINRLRLGLIAGGFQDAKKQWWIDRDIYDRACSGGVNYDPWHDPRVLDVLD